MAGILYLILCAAVGFSFLSLLLPQVFTMNKKSFMGRELNAPSLFVALPASFLVGTIIMTWPVYFLAWGFSAHSNSLTYANGIVMSLALAFIILTILLKRHRLNLNIRSMLEGAWGMELIMLLIVLVIGSVLMFLSFFFSDNAFHVGLSVYSDFSTHLDMIRSFSHGNNFPTWYSHFAGEDIKYHFMFQFLAGNLEYLGLRLELAFNIPSLIFFMSACMLLYSLAARLFGKRQVGVIAVFLFLFRSSSSLWTYLSGMNGSIKEIVSTALSNRDFIGYTTNEEWGLYNLNVYANQRHLSLGLSMILLILLLMLPAVFGAAIRVGKMAAEYREKKGGSGIFFSLKCMLLRKEGWLPVNVRTAIAAGILLGLCSFWNGACVIACLLVLFFLAFAADRRLEFLITAVIAVGLAFIQSRIFISSKAFDFRFDPGYLADVKTVFGSVRFLFTLLGIGMVMIIAASFIVNAWFRWILFAFISPIIFAMTFQLTVDVSVNHKYIMIGCMLADIFIAAVLYRLANHKGIYVKAAALAVMMSLMATGIYEFGVFIRRNSPENGGSVRFSRDDQITNWVLENSDSRDIFLTDWYSLNDVVIGGAMLYYGWPYYAWSAGYDTEGREIQVHEMYSASDRESLMSLVERNNIRFIIVDRAARTNENYYVNEANIASVYEKVFTNGDDEWATNIYDTEKVIE